MSTYSCVLCRGVSKNLHVPSQRSNCYQHYSKFFFFLRRPFYVLVQLIIFCLRGPDLVELLSYECLNYLPIIYCHYWTIHAACYLSGSLEAKMDSRVTFLHSQVPFPHLYLVLSPSRWKGSTMLNMAMVIRYMINMDPQLMDTWIERLTLVRTGSERWVGGNHLENPGNIAGRPRRWAALAIEKK